MTGEEVAKVLNYDLRNEWKHLHFYLRSAALVSGLHRGHLKAWLLGQASSEQGHVLAFMERVVSLGGVPADEPNESPAEVRDPKEILDYALAMEQEVVDNYAKRIEWVKGLGTPQGAYLSLFYEEQLTDSHEDLDEIREMLR